MTTTTTTTTVPTIDQLHSGTELPRQVEANEPGKENTAEFNEAVSRFQAALGEDLDLSAIGKALGDLEGLPADPEAAPVDAEGLPADPEAALVDAEDAPDAADLPDAPDVALQPETPVLQAAPMVSVPIDGTAVQQLASDTLKVTAVDPAAVRSQALAAAVEEVCEAIQVAPGVQPGQGEVRIQLKADVLSGTEVFLEAKGTTITVAFNPATADVAEILSRNITQFEQHLAERVHNYQIAAKVKKLKS